MAKKKKIPTRTPRRTQKSFIAQFQIEDLLRLMAEHDVSEINLKDGQKSVMLRRGPAVAAAIPPAPAPPPMEVPATQAAQPSSAAVETSNLIEIKSPMVGTFYAAPDIEAPPYVSPGGDIGPETVVCIVEAMKVMNEIKAECAGVIERCCVNNSEAVEYGQTLFFVRPT